MALHGGAHLLALVAVSACIALASGMTILDKIKDDPDLSQVRVQTDWWYAKQRVSSAYLK